MGRPAHKDSSDNPWGISDREAQVLDLLIKHGSVPTVATVMCLSAKTVHTYSLRARAKMGVEEVIQACIKWYEYRAGTFSYVYLGPGGSLIQA